MMSNDVTLDSQSQIAGQLFSVALLALGSFPVSVRVTLVLKQQLRCPTAHPSVCLLQQKRLDDDDDNVSLSNI